MANNLIKSPGNIEFEGATNTQTLCPAGLYIVHKGFPEALAIKTKRAPCLPSMANNARRMALFCEKIGIVQRG